MNDIVSKIISRAEDDYYALTDDEKNVYIFNSILDAVNKGSLIKYYKSHAGGYALEAIEYLYSIGLDEIAAIIESANAIFPDTFPPEDMEERLEIIEEFEDDYSALFDEWTEEILEFAMPLEAELIAITEKLRETEY